MSLRECEKARSHFRPRNKGWLKVEKLVFEVRVKVTIDEQVRRTAQGFDAGATAISALAGLWGRRTLQAQEGQEIKSKRMFEVGEKARFEEAKRTGLARQDREMGCIKFLTTSRSRLVFGLVSAYQFASRLRWMASQEI
jgi:hypothetical protein